MIAVVTIENQKHIYDIYGCIVCENNTVLLRVSYCYWDIVVYDVPISVIDFYVSHIKSAGYLDLTKYTSKVLEPINEYTNEPTEDDYDRELYYQTQERNY